MENFLNGFDWPFVVKMAVLLLALAGGVKTVPLINKLKTILKWSGRKVQMLVVIISVFLGISAQIVSGAITPTVVTPDYLLNLITIIVMASQVEYIRIKNSLN